MLVQLKKCEHPIEERIRILENFINKCVKKSIREVESSSQYDIVKEQLYKQLGAVPLPQTKKSSATPVGISIYEKEAKCGIRTSIPSNMEQRTPPPVVSRYSYRRQS